MSSVPAAFLVSRNSSTSISISCFLLLSFDETPTLQGKEASFIVILSICHPYRICYLRSPLALPDIMNPYYICPIEDCYRDCCKGAFKPFTGIKAGYISYEGFS